MARRKYEDGSARRPKKATKAPGSARRRIRPRPKRKRS